MSVDERLKAFYEEEIRNRRESIRQIEKFFGCSPVGRLLANVVSLPDKFQIREKSWILGHNFGEKK